MKRIEVSDTAAARIEALRDGEHLNMTKATICDLLCEIVNDADTDGTGKEEFLPLLVAIGDYVDLINALHEQAANGA